MAESMREYKGIPAADGMVIGPAKVWNKATIMRVDRCPIRSEDSDFQLQRLKDGLEKTAFELTALRDQLEAKLGREEASILDVQLLILEDEAFLGQVRQTITGSGLSAEAAFARCMAEALIPLDLSRDTMFKERVADFRDVEQRVLKALMGSKDEFPLLEEPCILVTNQLAPSETAALDIHRILGFCVDEGGATSHTAILARSLGVPAIMGLRGFSRQIQSGDSLAIDGGRGIVLVDPSVSTIHRFKARIRRRRQVEEQLLKLKDVPAETTDGFHLRLSANVELPLEIDLALANGARGIGLLRTEFFYFQDSNIPAEEEQFQVYRDVLERARGENVIFRILDVGGDKFLSAMGGYREYNPFLGWRGVRFLLSNRGILRTQLRALYRASLHGPMKIMFPMISGLDELRALNTECSRCRHELLDEGFTLGKDLELGIMIETPSAVAMAPELARECDFFSIGTNDLTQYILAVDRGNARVASLYQPHHPAVLRAIQSTINAAHDAGIWVGLCGEAGSDPLMAVLLLGMGIDEISVNAAALPMVKKVIRTVSKEQSEVHAREALKLTTGAEVEEFIKSRAHERLRDFLQPNE